MRIIREQKHRLEKEFYKGEQTVSFVACIKNRDKVFINVNIFKEFEKMLHEEIKKFDNQALIYLFMPDHLHLILKGESENSDVIKSMDAFKQKSGFWFHENLNQIKWQKDYYDHIIRNEEDLKRQICYILRNPVRSGIVKNWKDYKFRGSDIYDFEEWE